MRLSVDPGINGTGWALWTEHHWTTIVPPYRTGILTAPKKLDWQAKAYHLASALRNAIAGFRVSKLYIELPAYFPSLGGDMVARRGDLVKLTICAGYLGGFLAVPDTYYIPVMTWKGQLPKDVVERRIRRLLGEKACQGFRSHIFDAVGIGLYAKGILG